MRKILKIATVIMIAAIAFSANAVAADTSIKGTIYANWMMDLSKGAKNYNAFTVDRAYFGAESKLTDYTFMRITFDIRPERFLQRLRRLLIPAGIPLPCHLSRLMAVIP